MPPAMSDVRTFSLPTRPFQAEVELPGDKSLGHRALILAAMADGDSVVAGLSAGADIAATRRAIAALGVGGAGDEIVSSGIDAWTAPRVPLDCGNSATTVRLLAGALAGSPVSATLVGDDSLMRRPMARIVEPLRLLGADVSASPEGTPPITVVGQPLHGARVALTIASAQVRTSVALAALSAGGPTHLSSPPGFRDHTERWLAHLGRGRAEGEATFVVEPGAVPPLNLKLPGDPSSAAFLWTAAAIRPGSRLVTPRVSMNPGRTGFLDILDRMGATVQVEPGEPVMGDPVGTVTVTGAALRGIHIEGDLTVRALDELPLVAVLAAAADGETVVDGASELRVKESDRIESSVALARVAGGRARATPEGFIVSGKDAAAPTAVDARTDHRVAMAGAVASLARGSSVAVAGFSATAVSWPEFAEVLEGLWS